MTTETENGTATIEAPPEVTPAPETAPQPTGKGLPKAFDDVDAHPATVKPTGAEVERQYDYGDVGDAGDETPPSEPADEEREAEPSAEEETATPEKGEDQEPEKEATPATEEPMFDDGLMARAFQVGLRPQDIGQFDSADALRQSVTMIERRRADMPPAQPEAKPEPEPTTPEDRAYKGELDLENVDPEVAKYLKGMNDHYAAQSAARETAHTDEMNTVKEVVGKVIQQNQANARQGVKAQVSAWCDKHQNAGDILKSQVSRDKLLDKADVLVSGYRMMGQPPPPEAELLEEAFRAEFGNETKINARQDLTKQVEKRRRSAIARPTQRGTPPAKTGDAAAIKFAAEWMREHDVHFDQTVVEF